MKKVFLFFAALTLSIGLWADATYKAEGSKLMAYGVGSYTETNPVTLTIKAPADAMFNGTAIGVTLEGQEAWTNAGLDIPAINYDGIAAVPSMLGNHVATISAGGATASLNYKITTVLNYKSIFDGGIPSGDGVESNNVNWDDTEQCAVFDGNASYLVINNPLSNVDASTGFTITTEVYISSYNNSSGTYKRKNGSSASKSGWQRLFDLSNGTDQQYFFLNAGSSAHLRCAGTLNGNENEFQANNSSGKVYYNKWQTITLVVAPGGNITLYVDNTVVSYLESNDEIEQILNNIHKYTNCYIGTSIFEILGKGPDGFFIGKIRGFQIAEGPLMPYYDGSYHYYLGYETNGGNAIAGSFQNNLPNPLPTPTHTDSKYEFAGWYMDAAFTIPATAGAPLTKNTTLYAKWNVHKQDYTRDNLSDGKWGTICLGYAAPSLEGVTATFYKLNYYDGGANLYVNEVTELEAGKPYVFEAKAESFTVEYILTDEPTPAETVNGLIGTLDGLTMEADAYALVNNMVVKAAAGTTVPANRAYIDLTQVSTEPLVTAGAPRRIGVASAPTGFELNNVQKKACKVLDKGQFVIIRDNKRFNAQGIEIQ